uniref:FMR1 neighbor n=1 Tax=Ornithorhynchus anatinus TaxID=9258 RepID=A0A6I8MZA3_ORNAN
MNGGRERWGLGPSSGWVGASARRAPGAGPLGRAGAERPATVTRPGRGWEEEGVGGGRTEGWTTGRTDSRAGLAAPLHPMQAGPRLAAGWAMWVLCSGLLPGSTSSTEHTLRSNEEDVEGPVKPLDGTAALFDFFNPTTCRPKQGQTVIPCRAGMDLNKTECLHHKCCHSSWTQSQLKCYTPLKDRPQLTIRLFALGTGAMIILGCCPLCCCSLLQKRYREDCFTCSSPAQTVVSTTIGDSVAGWSRK